MLQKAMTKLDKWSTQEVMDNDWLKREVRDENIALSEWENYWMV